VIKYFDEMSIKSFFKKYDVFLCVAVAAMLLVAIHISLPKIHGSIITASGTQTPILLPDMQPRATTHIIDVDYLPWQGGTFQVYATQCIIRITVNGAAIPFVDHDCSLLLGSTLQLAPFLKQGHNTLRIDTGFPAKLHIGSPIFGYRLTPAAVLDFCLLATASLGLACYMRRRCGEWLTGGILSGGLMLCVYHFSQATFMQYTIDMPSHLEYIVFIANHWQLPIPSEGWQFYHPPLYYTLQAVPLMLANYAGSIDSISVLRSFSFACFAVFLIFSALILHRIIRNPIALHAALILMAFYPGGIMYAARIDSHLLFYSLYAACVYYTLLWVQESRTRHLEIALILLGFGLAERSNMLIMLPVMALAIIIKGCNYPIDFRSRLIWIGGLTILIGSISNFGRVLYYHQPGDAFLVNNFLRVAAELHIQNTLDHFVVLHIQSFLKTPFLNEVGDSSGRQYFIVTMLKTSLFGFFVWQNISIAYALILVLFMLIAYVALGAAVCWPTFKNCHEWWILIALLWIPIGLLMAERFIYPIAATQDFRYIYPSLAAFCGMLGMVIEQHMNKKRDIIASTGIILTLVFAGLSVNLFLSR
jgi:hypothetical protein